MSDQNTRQAIAIVGMACRMPGADSTAEFWELIRTGGQAFGPLPEHRLNRELLLDPEKGKICKTYTDLGGLISERPFDKSKNPISDELLETLDTAHKVMLEVAADACRDAGYNPFALKDRNAGVYIGNTGGSEQIGDVVYSTIVEEGAHVLEDVKAFEALGSQSKQYLQQVVDETRRRYPGRKIGEHRELGALTTSAVISEVFGLDGPMMVVDAACASSMQAMSVGIRALREGSIDMAFVGGASYCKSDSLVLFSAAQSVSPTGSCPFHAQADGLVTAEGYVILILKTLEKAIADKDNIHAVISGLGVSSDGRGKSLWAPLKKGQILAVQRAYSLNNLDPRRVQYIEAHATSTQVGDATELQALSESISGLIGDQAPKIPIGSVKGNIGHTLETAGMAGIVKTVLCLKHKTIPPVIKGDQLNEDVAWDKCPFDLPFAERPWPEHADGHPRRAAVNAFGIGGLNVHVVLDEYVPQVAAKQKLTIAAPSKAANSDDDRAIAIIGMGCILPGAKTLQAFWDLLLSERDALIEAPRTRMRSDLSMASKRETWKITGNYGGFIPDYAYDWRKHKIPPKQIANANPLQFMLLDAADQAINNAGLNEKNIDSLNTAVIVGTCFGGDFSNQLQMGLRLPEFQRDLAAILRKNNVPEDRIAAVAAEYQDRLFQKMPAMLDETGSFTSSTLASRITKAFNLMGGAMAIDAGLCSSLLSIQAAVDMLRQRDANVVVCAAGQRSMDVWVYESLCIEGLLADKKPGAPFTAQANGIVPGEGCGVVVLKRLADARRDGNPIHAVIRGVGAAAHESVQRSVCQATTRALRDADLPATAVEAVEMHGFGMLKCDQAEYTAIRETYASANLHRQQPLQLGAVRHQLGDLGGASGMAALIKAARSATEGQLPATIGFTQLSPEIGDGRVANFAPRKQQIPAYTSEGYRAIAVTSLHGRMAYQLILDNGMPKPKNDRPLNDTIIERDNAARGKTALASLLELAPQLSVYRFSGNSRADLLAQIASERTTAEFDETAGLYRLGLVASSAGEFQKKLRLATEALRTDNWKLCTEQGIFYCDPTIEKPRVAFLFPGQGSQYHGMFEKLAQNFAPTAKALEYANSCMRLQGFPTYAELAGSQATGLGSDVWQTQISMLLADFLALQTIRSLGVKPEYITGHSFGEYPALLAAGVWTLPQAITATRGRCDAVTNIRTTPSAMVSLLANREMTNRILEQVSAEAWLCAENSPEQCVVGGTIEGVERVQSYCTQQQITAKRLRVPCAFHTPLLERTHEPLRAVLEQLELNLPQTPFLSATYARFLADPADVRDSLVDQMSHPVEFVSVIRKLRAQGINTFLEIGPSQVLTQLTRKILNTDPAVRCLPLDVADANSHEALIRMALALETWGALNQASTETVSEQPRVAAASAVGNKPAPKFVDATETRRARMRAASRGTAPRKAVQTVLAPQAVPAKPTPAVQHAEKPSNNGHDTNGHETNGHVTNGKNHGHVYDNGHAANGHSVNGNGHHRHEHRNGHSEPPRDSSASGRVSSANSAQANSLPENWTETLAWLQTQAQISGLRGQLASLLDQPWKSLGIDTADFFGRLQDFYELVEPARRQLTQSKNARELCELLCAMPGKTSWLERSAPANAGLNSEELAQFLVQFVVDQTGYPQEMVELDADLEADLGIDSIKKAQLFGEIGERFSLSADPNLSLDDFPTLQHVQRYIEKTKGLNSNSDSSATSAIASKTHSASPKTKSYSENRAVEYGTNSAAAPEQLFAGTISSQMSATALLEEPAVATEIQGESEITDYLVNFVIDQTGYPAEMVDLDADLEADLGIDSIKKAQLFGEIGEQYSLSADPNLSLDDFPTLRHVANYITRIKLGQNKETCATVAPAKAASPLAAVSVNHAAPPAKSNSPQQHAAPGHAEQSDHANFLVQFVVEQTGYPEDMVDLDADLEADLGIDSIKKAQLFGEIGERYSLSADPNLSLDDFPTLRHVADYITQIKLGKSTPSSARMETAKTTQSPSSSPAAVVPPAKPTASVQSTAETQSSSVEHSYANFLVQFVIEQTGYPEDMVDLNADLEADLGIDSIKKAQLFGEIGERFQLSADPNLTLDDFPTLNHVLEFLVQQKKSATSVATPSASATTPRTTSEKKLAESKDSVLDKNDNLSSQAPFNEGFRRGQSSRLAIRDAIRRHADTSKASRELALQIDNLANLLDLTECAELAGLADGAGVLIESLRACNFTSGVLTSAETEFTRDLATGELVLRGHCLAELKPELVVAISGQGHKYLEWMVPGYLGCLAGISEHSLAIAIRPAANSKTSDQFPAAILAKRVLRDCANMSEATQLLDRSRWQPGALIAVTDLEANQVTHWTTDAAGRPVRSAATVVPGSAHDEVLTTAAQRQLGEIGSARLATSSFHWLRLQLHGDTAVYQSGDQWQTSAAAAKQKTLSLTFAPTDLTVASRITPLARQLPPVTFPAGERITKRFIPTLVAAERRSSALRPSSVKSVVMLGQDAASQALAAELQTQGFSVLPLADNLSAAQINQQIEALGACHLVLSAAGEYSATSSAAWTLESSRILERSFAVAQQWLGQQQSLGILDHISLTALTSLGGTLGLAPTIANPLGGGLTGFCKAVRNEYPNLRVKVLDFALRISRGNLGRLLSTEWLSDDNELEVALHGDERMVIRYREPALPIAGSALPQAGDQWVITGGARGITAAVARDLAARYGVHLNILGSTHLTETDARWLSATNEQLKAHKAELMKAAKQRGEDALAARKYFENQLEIAKNLELLRNAGISSHYHVCDVTDWNAVSSILAAIRKRGPIRGILHGAGFEAAAKFEKKKLAQVQRTIQVKCGGAAALMALTARDPLGWFIGFGSTSGRFGGMGQTDYSLANDLLAKQVSQLREQRPDCRAATVHWHAWGEIGMAARPESKFALEAFGLKMMPPAEGIAYLLTEIDAGLPEREIVITEDLFVPNKLRIAESAVSVTVAPAQNSTQQHQPQDSTAKISESELKDVLINFVVEQTGYPEDMVELDADLEADLGIDSIKKAQLFGEIGERFQLSADPNLTLDDFPTLGHVLQYLLAQTSTHNPATLNGKPNQTAAQSPAVNTSQSKKSLRNPVLGPLLDRVKSHDDQCHEAIATFDPQNDIFLQDHRRNGQPMLPGTFGWELLTQAAAALDSGNSAIRLTNVNILNPLDFADTKTRTVRIQCRRVGNSWQTQSVTEHKDRSGRTIDENRPLITGEIEFLASPPQLKIEQLKNPFPLNPMIYAEDKEMFHGKTMRTCISLLFQHGGGWAKLKNFGHQTTAGKRPHEGWLLPAGMLDGAIVGCAVFGYLMCGQRIEIPQGVEELILFRQPKTGESCQMQFRLRENNERHSWYDFEIFGEDKSLVAVVRGLRLVSLGK